MTCALVLVDLAALTVGLTILRRVTKLVISVGDRIHEAVESSIEQARQDAVTGFLESATPIIAAVATGVPKVVREALSEVASSIRVTASGAIQVQEADSGLKLVREEESSG